MRIVKTLPFYILPLLALLLTGCQLGILAMQPFVLTYHAIDETMQIRTTNTDFFLAGPVIDENGQPINGVTLNVRSWTVIEFSDGLAWRWEEHREQRTVDGRFEVSLANCQAVDLRFEKPGYFHQRAFFVRGRGSPIHDELGYTWLLLDGTPPAPTNRIEELNGGGHSFDVSDSRPVRIPDLQIILDSHGPLAPVTILAGRLIFNPRGESTIVDLDRRPPDSFVKISADAPVPLNSMGLISDLAPDGTPAERAYSSDLRCPVNPRLVMSDPDGGFLPSAVTSGQPDEKRLPFMHTAPAAGYKRELPFARLAGCREDEGKFWFFFKSGGRYGCGTVAYQPHDRGAAQIGVYVRFYLQPDGSRDLKGAEFASPVQASKPQEP